MENTVMIGEHEEREDEFPEDEITSDMAPDEIPELDGESRNQRIYRKLSYAQKHPVKFKDKVYILDSTLEFMRYRYLRLLYDNNIIRNLEIHKVWDLIPENKDYHAMTMESDFEYDMPRQMIDGTLRWDHVTEDAKRYYTSESKLKHKMFRHKYGYCVCIAWYDVYDNQFTVTQGYKIASTEYSSFDLMDRCHARLLLGEKVVLRDEPYPPTPEKREFEVVQGKDGRYSFHTAFFADGSKFIFRVKEGGDIPTRIEKLGFTKDEIDQISFATPIERAQWGMMFMRRLNEKLKNIPIHSEWIPVKKEGEPQVKSIAEKHWPY